LVLWACLSLYWGSTLTTDFRRITVYAINLDDGSFGPQIISGIQAASDSGSSTLGWRFDATNLSDQASKDLVLNEDAWAVLQSKHSRLRHEVP
jgi:hypothetical protein